MVIWLFLYRDPKDHKRVTEAQRVLLHDSQGIGQAATEAAPVSLGYLLRQRTIWGMMIGFFCLNFAIYFFITWFPSFLMNARHFSLEDVRYYGLFPALFAIPFGWIGGAVSDALLRRGWSATSARKSCLVGGMIVSCVIAFAPIVESSVTALVLMGISYAALAFTAANIWTLPGEVAPSAANVALIGALQNGAANLAGIGISTFTGLLLMLTGGSFVLPLALAGALCLVGAFAYLFIMGPVERIALPQDTRK